MKKTNCIISAILSLTLVLSVFAVFNVSVYADGVEPKYKNVVLDAKELYLMDEADMTNKPGTAMFQKYVARQITDTNGYYNGTGNASLARTTKYVDGTYGYYIATRPLRLTSDAGYQITQVRVSVLYNDTITFEPKYSVKVENWHDKYYDLTSVEQTATRNGSINGYKDINEADYVINDIPYGTMAIFLPSSASYYTRIEFTEQKIPSYDVTVTQGVTDKSVETSNMHNYGYYHPANADGSSYVIIDTQVGNRGIKPEWFYFASTKAPSNYLKIYTGNDKENLTELDSTKVFTGPSYAPKVNNKNASLYYIDIKSVRYIKLAFTKKDYNHIFGNFGWVYPAAVVGQLNNADGSTTLNLNSKIKSWNLVDPVLINVTMSNDTFENADIVKVKDLTGTDYTVVPVSGKTNSILVWDLSNLTPICYKMEIE